MILHIRSEWHVHYLHDVIYDMPVLFQLHSTNQYMGFGLSGSDSATVMVGADPTIAWVDPLDGPQAVDYYLSAYTQVGII